jgi:hypothetical protein
MDQYEKAVLIGEAFYFTRPAEAFEVRQTHFPVTTVVQNLTKLVIRVYERLAEGISKLQSKRMTRNGMRDEERRFPIGVRAAGGF